jgi:hypothetical protein
MEYIVENVMLYSPTLFDLFQIEPVIKGCMGGCKSALLNKKVRPVKGLTCCF